MDATHAAIVICQLRWNRAPTAEVIDFFAARYRLRRKRADKWLRTYTRPMPDPEAA